MKLWVTRRASGRFTQVSAGSASACGMREAGTLACWGDKEYGEASAPSARFDQVSAGGVFACDVRVSGKLGCWGLSWNGTTTLRRT
jgi:Regulator of chromosome condensation (RCC1) repeat